MAPSPSRMARGGTQFIASAFAFGRDKCDHPAQRTTAGRTPLATACAAHCVRGICRYGCDPRGDGALAIAHGTSGGVQFIAPTLSVATSATLPRDVRRRGAPLLRPLARLTAFGGYVATGATLVAMAPSPSRMARVEGSNSLRPRFRSRQARPSRATFDGGAHPSCDRLRGSLRSGDMSLRAHHRGDGALAIVPSPPRLLGFVV